MKSNSLRDDDVAECDVSEPVKARRPAEREVSAMVLDTAKDLITRRRTTHGQSAVLQHQVAADMWTAYLRGRKKMEWDKSLTPHEVMMLMDLLKSSRDACGDYNHDNYVDKAGYTALAGAARMLENTNVPE